MGDVPSIEGERVGGVKKIQYGRFCRVTFPLYSSMTISGHIELILASDGVPWGERWVMCHPKRVTWLEE